MKSSILVTASCVMFLAGCGAPQSSFQVTVETPKTQKEFRAATAAFHQALRTNDAEAFLSFVAEDVVLMPPGEAPVRGNYMQVWKLQTDGQWRFAREVYNSSVPTLPSA